MSHAIYRPEDTRFEIDRDTLIRRLREVLPKESCIDDVEGRAPFECDGLAAYRQLPLAVALPEDVPQLQAVIKVCRELGVPIVTRGAGTGLSGGALPHPQGVLLVMSKFNRILDVDVDARLARVQPGVRNLAVSEAVAPHGLYYAPDPSSQIACSIGGNIAENAGGVHCLKYGLTVHNVVEVKIVTLDGELLTLGSAAGDAPGYDMLAAIHGSEGMLGVVVEATLRLLPKPAVTKTLLADFKQVESAGNAVAAVIAGGIIPAGMEMMDNAAIQAAEAFVHANYPTDAGALVICELDGQQDEVDRQMERVKAVFAEHEAGHIRVAKDEAERLLFWAGRKGAFPAVGRLSPDYYCMDGTIPRKHLADVLGGINRLSDEYGLRVVNVFHAGDGNLHPLILYNGNEPGQLEKTEQLGAEILKLCVDVGGTVTGEHGVGVEKIDVMCSQFNAAELSQFHRLKAAFDPDGLLNPGKAIPTLNRCAEFGAMHVHRNELPHSELERF